MTKEEEAAAFTWLKDKTIEAACELKKMWIEKYPQIHCPLILSEEAEAKFDEIIKRLVD